MGPLKINSRYFFSMAGMLVFLAFLPRLDPASKPATSPSPAAPNRHTLVFVDKSLSLSGNTDWYEGYRKELKKFIVKNYIANGDRVKGYFLHSNTLGATPFVESVFQVEKPSLEGKGYQTRKQLEMDYDQRCTQAKKKCLDKIDAGFKTVGNNTTNQETDIWSAAELISRFFAQAKAGDQCFVFLISDMLESVKGPGRRDFHRQRFKSKAEAEQAARQDVKWILTNRSVKKENMGSVVLYLWTPPNTTGASDWGVLRYYWRTLFGELGVKEITEEMSAG